MPTLGDVQEQRLASVCDKVRSVIDKGELETYKTYVEKVLDQDITALEIAAACLKMFVEKQSQSNRSGAQAQPDFPTGAGDDEQGEREGGRPRRRFNRQGRGDHNRSSGDYHRGGERRERRGGEGEHRGEHRGGFGEHRERRGGEGEHRGEHRGGFGERRGGERRGGGDRRGGGSGFGGGNRYPSES